MKSLSLRRVSACGALCLPILLMSTALHATVSGPTIATTMELTARIDAQIDQPRFAGADWGIVVVSLDSGRTLYAHRADRLMQPASTAKLFTAATSLATLGPSYRMPTRVLASAPLRNGRLEGSLTLYGMGDPTLGTAVGSQWADQLASQLAARGIRLVHGDLVADDSYFAGPSFGSGWEAADLQSWFAVPSSALSVQENVVDLKVQPAPVVGAPAHLVFTPTDAALPVEGALMTSAAHTLSDINLYRAPGENVLHVFGNLAARSPSQHFRLALPDPALLAGRRLRQAMLDHGIRITGKVRVLHWPQDDAASIANARMLAQVLSPPLVDVLQQGLKRSQNLYLQNLLLAVGANEHASVPDATPGFASTESYAIRAMHRLLTQIGIPAAASQITEGTGLSRRDLVTPNAMTRLLVYLATQSNADVMQNALPDAGVDGTLAGRMRGTAAAGNVRAKTGNMAYVHCLAGYVTTAAGERLAFSIMLNNYLPPPQAPRASSDLDAIAETLAGFTGRS
jgi:D-alanyl-D-alanine carboxypeptidase/D-alanyl-D-alanine-endopeptidase (penicillin-binding protein 4)